MNQHIPAAETSFLTALVIKRQAAISLFPWACVIHFKRYTQPKVSNERTILSLSGERTQTRQATDAFGHKEGYKLQATLPPLTCPGDSPFLPATLFFDYS